MFLSFISFLFREFWRDLISDSDTNLINRFCFDISNEFSFLNEICFDLVMANHFAEAYLNLI